MTEVLPTLPADWYLGSERYERERSSVFANEWVWFANGAEITEDGWYVAWVYAGWPLMVVRGNDGVLRGFHNVCRHRAGPLVDDGAGVCGNLVCRYHGWAYSFDGRLRSARDFGEDLDADEFALHPIQVAVWRGQVFVNLNARAVPLEEDLAEFFAEMRGFPIEAMTLVRSAQHDLACNWKTYADNYLEGYHIPLLHPELNRQFDAKQYRVDVGDRYCRHSAPARDGSPDDGRWLFRWPNLAMNIYGDSMNVEVIVPTGPQTCTVLYSHSFCDPNAPDVHDVIALSDTVMDQDRRMVEVVQRNLAAGTYRGGVLSPRHENGLQQFQDLVRARPTLDDSEVDMTDQQEFLGRIADIADVVRSEAAQAEIDRRLGDKTVAALLDTGLLRMLLPEHYGGGGLFLGDTFPIVEAVSRVDGSAGWNLQIGATTVALANDLADEGARDEVLGDERSIVAGTINFVNIKARRAEGGFVFDGEATFLSGSSHANWLVVGGWLHDDKGKPKFGKGMPQIVRGIIPIDAIELRDTWHVSGMRATASNDATLDAMFVPDRFLCSTKGTGLAPGDPAGLLPLFSRFGGGLSWVGIGIAKRALDALRTIATTKVAMGSGPLAERADVQIAVARAHGMLEAGSAFLREAWADAHAKLGAGQKLDAEDQARLRLSYVTGAEYAAHATDLVVGAAGSSGLYERDGIERCWRDAHAVTKHVTVSARFYDRVGRIYLGLPPLPGPI